MAALSSTELSLDAPTGWKATLGRFMASVVVTSLLSGGLSPSYQTALNESNFGFESADLVSATDIAYPIQSIAIGTVVLEATVSESGNVEDVRPIREIQSVTSVAIDSIKSWHFKPASLDGRPVRSRAAVAVTFNPAAAPAASVPPSSAVEQSAVIRSSPVATGAS